MSSQWVTIASFETATHASLLRMRLEQAGIPCLLANEHYNGVARGLFARSIGYAGVWLQVPPDQLERAQEIQNAEDPISPYSPDALELDRQVEASMHCPNCGSEEVEYQEVGAEIQGSCAACGHHWVLA